MARRLEDGGKRTIAVTNLGVNGWTTQQVIEHELPRLGERKWDVVTILAGVNDEYQGVDAATYKQRIEGAHSLVASHAPVHVVALSIPDYSYTTVGHAAKDTALTVARLREFNAIAEASAQRNGFAWIDLFDVSRERRDDPAWVASDGLHPSDVQYARWAEHIAAHFPGVG